MHVADLATVTDAALFGGKAAQLGAALRASLPVPGGFAIDADGVLAIVQGDSEAEEKVRGAFASLVGWVAVRSSGIGEDGVVASFAGQHETKLNLATADAVIAAVKVVWQSGHAPSARAYRERLGIAGDPRVGVVVQRLIDSECAGVLFTRNPITGADERLIEAAWGLGEVVVQGLVTPDQYRIARDGSVLARVAGHKDLAIVRAKDGGIEERDVAIGRVDALCLDDARLAALHRVAARCEEVFGGAQDLEWAFDAAGLWLLQRRPLTRFAPR